MLATWEADWVAPSGAGSWRGLSGTGAAFRVDDMARGAVRSGAQVEVSLSGLVVRDLLMVGKRPSSSQNMAQTRPAPPPQARVRRWTQFSGASTASQIPNTQVAGDRLSSRSELFVHSPFPVAVYQEAIPGNQGRGACNVGHVTPLSVKLELLNLDEWNENGSYAVCRNLEHA
jgi:hypothetical protein